MKKIANIYIEENDFEKRQTSAVKIIQKHQNKVPIIISFDKNISKENYFKYVISRDMECGYILNLVRKSITLSSNKGIFILTENGHMITGKMILDNVYKEHKNTDLNLYLYVYLENTFGK